MSRYLGFIGASATQGARVGSGWLVEDRNWGPGVAAHEAEVQLAPHRPSHVQLQGERICQLQSQLYKEKEASKATTEELRKCKEQLEHIRHDREKYRRKMFRMDSSLRDADVLLEKLKQLSDRSQKLEQQVERLQEENSRWRQQQQYNQAQLQLLREKIGESAWQEAGLVIHGVLDDNEDDESAFVLSPAEVARLKDAYVLLHKTCEAQKAACFEARQEAARLRVLLAEKENNNMHMRQLQQHCAHLKPMGRPKKELSFSCSSGGPISIHVEACDSPTCSSTFDPSRSGDSFAFGGTAATAAAAAAAVHGLASSEEMSAAVSAAMVVPELKAEGDVACGRVVSISSKISGAFSKRSWSFFAPSRNPFSFSFPRLFSRSPAAPAAPWKKGTCIDDYVI